MTMARQFNLFDPALQKKRDWLALGNVVGVAVLLAVLVGLTGHWVRADLPALKAQTAANDAQIKTLREQMTQVGLQVAGRKPDPRLEQELATARLLLAARGEVLSILQQGLDPATASYADFMRGFTRQSLPGLWLTGFAFDTASGGIEISGNTTDPALLPEYIQRLNREPAFQGRAFSALKLAAGKRELDKAGGAAAAPAAPAAAVAPLFHEFKLTPTPPNETARQKSATTGKSG